MTQREAYADVVIVGGGLGGVSAALAAARRGQSVIMTEPNRWLGGQLTSQLTPLDEHLFIERDGANSSYRALRNGIRDYHRRCFPLTDRARHDPYLNPGAAIVSPVSALPTVAVAVIDEMLAPYVAAGRVQVWLGWRPVAADTDGDRVLAVEVAHDHGERCHLLGRWFIDATETGELLPLTATEYVTGKESWHDTGEPSAPETARPGDLQGVNWSFIVDHRDGEDHVIDRPARYDFFRDFKDNAHGGVPLLSFSLRTHEDGTAEESTYLDPNQDEDPDTIELDHRLVARPSNAWCYRRVLARQQFRPGAFASDIMMVNWAQNDYALGSLYEVPDAAAHWAGAKELSRCLVYWLQTEAPRRDDGVGFPGLRLRPDCAGTEDGFAQHPYIRESRRIRAVRTIVEQDVDAEIRGDAGAVRHRDTVGVGHYFWIDRHPTIYGSTDGMQLPHPFEIPLSGLVPQRMRNLLPAAKNIGTTHITNGCYRLHPVEWSIGEAVGELVAYCSATATEPQAVLAAQARTEDYQAQLRDSGVQLQWKDPQLWTRWPVEASTA